jgi:hypothetical protein
MNSKEYELLHGVANQRFPPWIEDPDRLQTTKDLVEWVLHQEGRTSHA